MSIFKKQSAITIDKLGTFKDIVINQETVKFTVNYSTISFKSEEIPQLLADVMELYVIVKPLLNKTALEAKKGELKELEDSATDDSPIDLTDIPF